MSDRGFLDDFHNTAFKIKHKFYRASRPLSQRKFPGAPMAIFDQILSATAKPKVLWKNPIRIWRCSWLLGSCLSHYQRIHKYGPQCKAESHTWPSSDKSFRKFSNVRYYGIRWKGQKNPTKRPTIAGLACIILGRGRSYGKQKRKALNCDTASYS